MRRLALTVLLALLAGPAAAATIHGTAGPDVLRGTRGADTIFGLGGRDTIRGLGGNDLLDGGAGRDLVSGGTGSDRIAAQEDGAADTVTCGKGVDLVDAELGDRVASDCEIVSRQLSRDTLLYGDAQPGTQVEPAAFGFGSTVVAAFQSSRFFDAGAAGVGFATSLDGGRTWRSGVLPALTIASTPSGPFARASDPSVAYDAVHGIWLVASLAIGADHWALAVSRAADGLGWSAPVTAVAARPESLDKEWITCDDWPSSPHRGSCYLSYLDVGVNAIATATSTDGGLTWGRPVLGLPSSTEINGAQPVVRPDGTLVVVYASFSSRVFEESEVLAVRSTDGGASFSPPARVAVLTTRELREFRSPALPAAGVDAAGRLYAVWEDCRFSSGCARNDLVLSTSTDGTTWSDAVRIPTTFSGSQSHSLVAGLGVDPATGGPTARLAVVYYVLRPDSRLDVATTSSSDGGGFWSPPTRLDAEPMSLSWIARTNQGAMVGDYVAVAWAGGRPVPVFSLASPPLPAGTLRQSIFARVR